MVVVAVEDLAIGIVVASPIADTAVTEVGDAGALAAVAADSIGVVTEVASEAGVASAEIEDAAADQALGKMQFVHS